MGDHRLLKRIMSEEFENVDKHGPGGGEKEWTNCGTEYHRVFGIAGDWSAAALDRGVRVQHSMGRGL